MLIRDIRFALRSLRRRRTFAAIAIGTLALGIGASTSIYSVVDGILFRPLPFNQPDRLTAVWQTYPHWKKEPILARSWDRINFSIPEYRDWRAAQKSFTDVALVNGGNSTMLGQGDTREIVRISEVSSGLLDVLAVRPFMGQFFEKDDDTKAARGVTVVSYEGWQSRFGGDRDIVGKTIQFDNGPYRVIGVLPKGFSVQHGQPVEQFLIPVGVDSNNVDNRGNHSFNAIGRLAPGATIAGATRELDSILRGTRTVDFFGLRLQPWQVDQTRNVRQPLFLLLGAVALLLIIACVNVATLLLGEATAREHEMAARIALGADRWRLVRQLLTESVVLGGLGALLGTALAWAGTKALVAMAPTGVPGLADVRMDVRVLGFAAALALLTGLLFGLAPAIALARRDPATLLRGGRGQSARRGLAAQPLLVAVELSLSFMLLVGAGLLTRSLMKLTAVDPGFNTENLVVMRPALPLAIARDSVATRRFYADALQRMAAVPGVVAASAGSTIPFTGGSSSTSITLEGEPEHNASETKGREAQQRTIVPGFFAMMGIRLVAGRDFNAGDRPGGPLVLVVNETMAKRDWPGASPIGRKIRFQNAWREIVGVVSDTRFGKLSSDMEATVFAPNTQRQNTMMLLARTRMDPLMMLSPLRAAIRAAEPGVVITRSDRMTDLVRNSFADERYRTTLISLFGAIAVLLAAAGMYGVVSRAVGRRTREMGIRIALGATPGSVTRLVVTSTVAGLSVGLIAGLIGSMASTRFLASFLYGISPSDPVSYAGVVVLLATVSVGASWIPARRAASVEPVVVLRQE